MFKRILLLWDNINDTLELENNTELILTNEEILVIDEVCQLLKPIENATKLLSGDNYPTTTLIIPTIKHIILQIEKIKISSTISQKFKESLLKSLNDRFKKIFNKELLIISSFLNPIFKSLKFLQENEKNNILLKIKMLMKEFNNNNNNNNNKF
jgi:hypothetical protein